jgi:hypothetical protein
MGIFHFKTNDYDFTKKLFSSTTFGGDYHDAISVVAIFGIRTK